LQTEKEKYERNKQAPNNNELRRLAWGLESKHENFKSFTPTA
jgi:hypothetical protein